MGVSIPDKTGYEKIGNQKIGNQKTEHKNIELLSHPLQKINIRSMFLQNGGLQMEDCKWRIANGGLHMRWDDAAILPVSSLPSTSIGMLQERSTVSGFG